jgi:hypothetical protein
VFDPVNDMATYCHELVDMAVGYVLMYAETAVLYMKN